MKERKSFLPKHRRILEGMGENVRLARLRRKLSAAKVAERAGISRNTLYLLEKGTPTTSIASLFSVLIVLGMEEALVHLGKDDELGRRLEDARLTSSRKRAPRNRTTGTDKTKP